MDCDEKNAFIVQQQKTIRRLCDVLAVTAQMNVASTTGGVWFCTKDNIEGKGNTPEAAVIAWLDACGRE